MEILDSEASNEDDEQQQVTATYNNSEPETALQDGTSETQDNQLGFIYTNTLEIENGGFESDPLQQIILPGTSRKVNFRPQQKQNDGHGIETQQQHVINPGPARKENARTHLNENDRHGCAPQQQQVIPPGPSPKVNSRPQLNENASRGCEPQLIWFGEIQGF